MASLEGTIFPPIIFESPGIEFVPELNAFFLLLLAIGIHIIQASRQNSMFLGKVELAPLAGLHF